MKKTYYTILFSNSCFLHGTNKSNIDDTEISLLKKMSRVYLQLDFAHFKKYSYKFASFYDYTYIIKM